MHFDLTDEQRDIRDTARSLLEQRSSSADVRAASESRRQQDALWQEMCDLGWPGIAISEQYGGQTLGLVELCILAEEQGAALAATPLLPSACAARVIQRAGSDAQRERWLAGLASGSARGAIGFATPNGQFVAGAPPAEIVVVAHEDAALSFDAESCEITPIETIDGTRPYAMIAGDGVKLPGDSASGVREAAVAISAELLGIARRALADTVAYVKDRRQFGVPVGSFQAVAHRCAEMLLQVESARSAVYFAAWTADADPARLPEASSLAKYVASQAAVDVTASAIQLHGGIGFTWEADVHWWYKRAQLSSALLGGAGAHLRVLGALLADATVQGARQA